MGFLAERATIQPVVGSSCPHAGFLPGDKMAFSSDMQQALGSHP